jgi:TolA-binding protein
MGNLRRKSQTEILEIKSPFSQTKNTMEGHSSKLKRVEERISELEDKIEIKEKIEEIFIKQLKSCERDMQDLNNFAGKNTKKRQNSNSSTPPACA